MANSIGKVFGNKVRVRVLGLLFWEDKLLLIKHRMDDYELWAPPGGGIEFGESIEETLAREFKEETGINITVKEFLFLTEHVKPPLHAVELFFRVTAENFDVKLGDDPELAGKNIFMEFSYVGVKELAKIRLDKRHTALRSCTNPIELLDKQGHLK